jgi:hypothetical protein
MATCEGRVIDVLGLGPNVVTMVRYWGSKRSMRLNFERRAIWSGWPLADVSCCATGCCAETIAI